MLVYRIGHKNYIHAFAASGIAGRWASSGRQVIYTAGSLALALLENMVRRQGVGFNDYYKMMLIDVPDSLGIESVAVHGLPSDWRSFRDYSTCQAQGDKWYDRMQTPLLKVPSAVLPASFNYVINTQHPDFSKIKVIRVVDYVPDERIEDILKHYNG